MKKRSFLILFVSALLSVNAAERQVYLFSSFMDPAKDGLHYLYSYDGLHWNALKGSWLKPEIGNKSLYWDYEASKWAEPKYYGEPLMRDPSITQGPDGTYHLVWTMSWMGDKGFAYSSSKDLIHWTHQREIVVMKDSVTNNVWAPEVLYDSKK